MTVHDEALASRIRTALAMDKRLCGLPIDVRVRGGDIFMKGKVESAEQVDVVRFIISGMPGVRHVNVDELQITEGFE